MRRVWLRGLDNVQKRYLLHVAGFNLALLMRKLLGHGTPKGWASRTGFVVIAAENGAVVVLLAAWDADGRFVAVMPLAVVTWEG